MGGLLSLPRPVAIYRAVLLNEVDSLKAILHETCNGDAFEEGCLEWMDDCGDTALTVAALKGHTTCLELLLEIGADFRRQNPYTGQTALHAVVESGLECRISIAEALLAKGANPFVENREKRTPWHLAAQKVDVPLMRLFEKKRKLDSTFARFVKVIVNEYPYMEERKWICVLPQYRSSQEETQSLMLYVFDNDAESKPSFTMDLSIAETPALRRIHDGWTVLVQSRCTERNSSQRKHVKFVFREDRTSKKTVSRFVKLLDKGTCADCNSSEITDSLKARLLGRQSSLYSAGAKPRSDSQSMSNPPRRRVRSVDFGTESVQKTKHGARTLSESNIDVQNIDTQALDDGSGTVCVICLQHPATVGLVHGTSVHRCICTECLDRFREQCQVNCPICRQEIEHIVTEFF